MIKFFRGIRKLLLAEGKFFKYLIYALGEIILIVIGILIALQFTNLNDKRKSNAKELNILKDLKKTITLNYPGLKRAIEGNEKSIQSCQLILKVFEENRLYNDSLNFHFEQANMWWRHFMDMSTYIRVTNYGLDFIKEDEVRNRIHFMYTTHVEFEETLNRREENYYYYTASPILTRLFKSTEIALYGGEIAGNHKPIDFERLKNNIEYKTILNTTIGNRKKLLNWLKYRLILLQELEEKLDALIKKKSKSI